MKRSILLQGIAQRSLDRHRIYRRSALLNQPIATLTPLEFRADLRTPRVLPVSFSARGFRRSWPSTESDKIAALTGRRERRPFVPQNRTVDFLWGYGIVRTATTGCASIYTPRVYIRSVRSQLDEVVFGLRLSISTR